MSNWMTTTTIKSLLDQLSRASFFLYNGYGEEKNRCLQHKTKWRDNLWKSPLFDNYIRKFRIPKQKKKKTTYDLLLLHNNISYYIGF